MYKLYWFVLLSVMLCESSFAQIVTGPGPKREGVDSSAIAVSNLMADPDEYKLPRYVVSLSTSVWAPTIKFEERINHSFSAGFNLGGRFIFFTGGRVEPFGRYYIKKHAPKGLFVQVKGIAGVYHTRILDGSWAQSIAGGGGSYHGRGGHHGGRNSRLPSTLLETYGVGAEVGYQFLVGHKKHCAIELFGGFQYVYSTLNISYSDLIQKMALQCPVDIGIKVGGAF